ncbi:hypothetical protein L6R52_24185 [Myxococcota bacterium]|nr:hypothetical protein [Myxococcota bacterium]
MLGGRGRVFAYDVSARKLDALKARASRAGLHSVKTAVVVDGREQELADAFRGKADVVLVDAPCSGWGVLRRNPDAKWRQDAAALARFPELQARLLATYAGLARPGGRVVYGVCTFRPEETTAVVDRVLAAAPRLRRGPGGYLGPGPTDGFFVQVLDVVS